MKKNNFRSSIIASLKNIETYGDTDVFPFSFEKNIFFDEIKSCANLLEDIHKDYEKYLAATPPETIETLSQVGYTGFRWATLIDPFWNAYYLALVINIAEKIEEIRIPICEKVVFSYRYEWNPQNSKLFKDITWNDYRKRCHELSNEYKFVIVTDISDFYPRIYHHRIENALNRINESGDIPSRIMKLLKRFSKNNSYGLPVGGPASRILSELALNSTDIYLHRNRVPFCRYADDYTIFSNSKSEAYKTLVFLSEKLFNEGLTLQKKKTKILNTEEFRQTTKLLDPTEKTDSTETKEEQKLLNISIKFDPYSPTSDEDYRALKLAVNEIDIFRHTWPRDLKNNY